MQKNQSQPTPEFTPGLDPLADSATVETLVRYDELDVAARERLESDPRVHATIAHLERADRWLQDLAHVSGPAPDAELLYDVGGGPGALSVDDDDRVRVEEHLAGAPTERGWVEAGAGGSSWRSERRQRPTATYVTARKRTARGTASWRRLAASTRATSTNHCASSSLSTLAAGTSSSPVSKASTCSPPSRPRRSSSDGS